MSVPERVAVVGGELAVEFTPGDTEPVLAIHGVSSNARLWNWLHAAAPELTLVRPDLRGRAASFDVTGPVTHRAGLQVTTPVSSLAQHADDMVAVLDAFDLAQVTVCGMSMGGFVAVELAARHPERVRDLVLVDGGFPMAGGDFLEADAVRTAFTPQASRHDQVFADVVAYREFFLSGPNLLDAADPLLTDYLAHDLGADGRPRLARDIVLDDAVDTLLGPKPWRDLTVPVRLLAAEWSTGAGSAPAYPDALLASYRAGLPSLVYVERIRGVDHGASIMTPRGAAAVAEQLRAAVVGAAG